MSHIDTAYPIDTRNRIKTQLDLPRSKGEMLRLLQNTVRNSNGKIAKGGT